MNVCKCPGSTAALLVLAFLLLPVSVSAEHPFKLFRHHKKTDVNVHAYKCDSCGGVCDATDECFSRVPVQDCAIGKKQLFRFTKACEYQTVPEIRYYLKEMKVTKEIPCPYCEVTFETKNVPLCYGEETWDKLSDECGQLECKQIKQKFENFPTKQCKHEEGETTIKVKYWSCVKVPYTVFRQVKIPIRVKQPCYEKVKVPVTRYVCDDCHQRGCHDRGCKRGHHKCQDACATCTCDTGTCDVCVGEMRAGEAE